MTEESKKEILKILSNALKSITFDTFKAYSDYFDERKRAKNELNELHNYKMFIIQSSKVLIESEIFNSSDKHIQDLKIHFNTVLTTYMDKKCKTIDESNRQIIYLSKVSLIILNLKDALESNNRDKIKEYFKCYFESIYDLNKR